MTHRSPAAGWQFWIDRGGTFTDIIGRSPSGKIHVEKHLSINPEQYRDAAVFGIRQMLGVPFNTPVEEGAIEAVKMGTTVGTNALLERSGEKIALLVTEGFADLLRIGYQHRAELFSLHIQRPQLLYETVHEVEERIDANGNILVPLNEGRARDTLKTIQDQGFCSIAIVLIHGYRHTAHEQSLAQIAIDMGFHHVSVSHQVSPNIKAVSRGDTTVVDAYLSPLLRRYVRQVSDGLRGKERQPDSKRHSQSPPLMFMQSNGGLIDASRFLGKDSILSGPAGGIVGAVTTCQNAGFDKMITFDMGGTSTDVAHYNGEYELSYETEISGVRLQCPMLHIHTVAAGGGSVLKFEDNRCRVGPESAGAFPGPTAYRRGGPLAVTDCNVLLGKLLPHHFPAVFGETANEAIDDAAVRTAFEKLSAQINHNAAEIKTVEAVAEGFLDIAVENMAQAIKKISVQRGYNPSEYTLCCFGGAGGQHACKVADALGMNTIFIHAHAGVLSALGMGLANNVIIIKKTIFFPLNNAGVQALPPIFDRLFAQASAGISPSFKSPRRIERALLKYEGSDSSISVSVGTELSMREQFEAAHKEQYGFVFTDKTIQIASVVCELRQEGESPKTSNPSTAQRHYPSPTEQTVVYTGGEHRTAGVYVKRNLAPGAVVSGPAIIIDPTSTIVVEPGWNAELSANGDFILKRIHVLQTAPALGTSADPILLELFNNRFMNVAEQMGYTFQNTAASVNIRERLDFSCALFDGRGDLIANAPHIPVHLGSMSQSVKAIIENRTSTIAPGDVFLLNSPYHGGTHLPDLTVISPMFTDSAESPDFFVASRGHHADVGGISPGSIPPHSRHINDEGVLFRVTPIIKNGIFLEDMLRRKFAGAEHPARNVNMNIADIKAAVAANNKGILELQRMVRQHGRDGLTMYMTHVKNNAEATVRRVIKTLSNGSSTVRLDTGDQICVSITVNKASRSARIDFSGTSPQNLNHNFNAPLSITHAAVLYVFRCLTQDIPLNSGCLAPLDIIVPEGSLLNPTPPAAVVAGNVETSQHIVDALLAAMKKQAGSQGTMNNLTFGNDSYQYYETICGGSGAGETFDGTDAVQCHMTNSRITDPEVLETRFPVILEQFGVRPNSGGNGLHRGGNGAVRAIRFKEAMTAGIVSSHRRESPQGLLGGENGSKGINRIKRQNGSEQLLAGCETTEVFPGDTLIIETPGGGGYQKK
ncbi:MAG: hydantoinase B/oxoprolinase family protein [Deltaproteobacteria bacterium]|nr:hydantoinase B/oxoprolinase family protein [Deltaproteobacteria bacterium]MBN2673622.1 hydantoinase B/oxoprolinase family protein [Deltaproteobacteria bacterium]